MSKTRQSLAQDLAWRFEALGYDLFVGVMRLLGVDAVGTVRAWALK